MAEQFTWICALVNTCHDCLPRHLETDELSSWESRGMPASGWSVCGDNCQCQVVPSGVAGDVAPLQREIDQTTSGLTVRVPNLQASPQTLANARADVQVRRSMRLLGQQNNPQQRAFQLHREREEARRRQQRLNAQRRRRR